TRREEVWQRQLTPQAEFAAEQIVQNLKQMGVIPADETPAPPPAEKIEVKDWDERLRDAQLAQTRQEMAAWRLLVYGIEDQAAIQKALQAGEIDRQLVNRRRDRFASYHRLIADALLEKDGQKSRDVVRYYERRYWQPKTKGQ